MLKIKQLIAQNIYEGVKGINPAAELTAEEETQLAEAGWVAIDYSSTAVGYVSAEFVTVAMELEEALSIEEEKK